MNKCIKGGGPLILGMGDNPSSKELVEYDEKPNGKRKLRRTLKKKSKRKMRKSQRKRK